jgi:hypothetical protein
VKKFSTQSIVITPGANDLFSGNLDQAYALIDRHFSGDWGEVCEEDAQQNDQAIIDKGMVLSAYTFNERKVWVITDPFHRVTTVLLPSEY